jgi:LCP family protein required for cell wall assembly
MGDMNALRDLGRELEHEPPASLARQRNLLLATSDLRRRPKNWMLFGAVAVVTMTAVLVPAVLLGRHEGAISTGQIGLGVAGTNDNGDLNVLILGSDEHGSDAMAPSDTMLIVHLPRSRKNITVVSIPRDSVVKIPACETRGGRLIPGSTGRIGSAFAIGGMNCALKTVEGMTDVRLDHVVAINFAGFKSMVNALGGVQVTLPTAVKDLNSGLNLPKGRQVVNGEQALAYVRVRHGLGDGSDLDRIKRQQQFMASMAGRAHGAIKNPVALMRFASTATKYVKTDKGLGLSQLVSILGSLKDTDTRQIRFVTVPWQASKTNPNQIQWRQPAADQLFATLRSGS